MKNTLHKLSDYSDVACVTKMEYGVIVNRIIVVCILLFTSWCKNHGFYFQQEKRFLIGLHYKEIAMFF